MTPEKIIEIIEGYKKQLEAAGIPKIRMPEDCYFRDLDQAGALAHAHYTCDNVIKFAKDPTKLRKTGSHLTVVQMCLSLGGWYTLGELMDHNRPKRPPVRPQFTQGITNFREPIGLT